MKQAKNEKEHKIENTKKEVNKIPSEEKKRQQNQKVKNQKSTGKQQPENPSKPGFIAINNGP